MPAPVDYETHFEAQYGGAEVRFGPDAYRFVLEITTGLRSAIPGETNVFGQFRNAWQDFRRDGPAARITRLAPLVHRLSNDTKAIRREHLHGIGGASYGSLVRRLIAPARADRILFVGAGNLAQSMLPFFDNYELGIWNHRPAVNRVVCANRFFRPETRRSRRGLGRSRDPYDAARRAQRCQLARVDRCHAGTNDRTSRPSPRR